MFTLVFKALENTSLSDVLKITSSVTTAEAYVNNDYEVAGITLNIAKPTLVDYALYQNEPNPFRHLTNVS